MPEKEKNRRRDLFNAVLMTYFILFVHLFIIAALGILVIFFRGLTQYMLWFFIGVIALILFSGFVAYRHIKARGKNTLQELDRFSSFRGRNFEVRLLGGLVSLKVDQPPYPAAVENIAPASGLQLEDPATTRSRGLTELAHLLENDLISPEEYTSAKKKLLNSP